MRYLFILYFIFFNPISYANNKAKDTEWAFISKLHRKNFSSKFEIKYFDDMKQQYDFQEGTAYWFKSGLNKVMINNPLKHDTWYKDEMITDFTPNTNQVSINEPGQGTDLAFELLISPISTWSKAYDITVNQNKLLLSPKEKSLIKHIEVLLDNAHSPYRFIITDKLNYQTVLTIQSSTKITNNNLDHMQYPKTAEVIDHVRHTII